VDCDPQANYTYALGGEPAAPGLFAILTGQAQAAQVIQRTQQADIISAGRDLSAAELYILNRPGRDFILREALAPLRPRYDLIVIDTQPDLNTLLVNALSASDSVILPMQANSFAIMGLYQIQITIDQVKQLCNPALTVAGILLTRYKPRQTLASDLRASIEQQAQAMGTKVFNTYIREGVAVEQAQALRQSLFDFAPRSHPAKDYKALYDELGL
jgi:chromosome partitioning protein